MARILVAWELGAGLGHVGPLNRIGQCLLHQHSQDVWFCYQTLHPGLPEAIASRMLQTPRIQHTLTLLPAPTGFSEILYNLGFGSVATLSAKIRAWRDLFALLRPDILVCEYSPFALLAATGLPMATVQIGNSWYIPPPQTPIPPYRLRDQQMIGRDPVASCRLETTLLQHANAALAASGDSKADMLETLSQLYRDVDLTVLTTVREFDHFERPQPAIYTGALSSLLQDAPALAWPDSGKAKVYAYLKDFPALRPLLRSLAASKYSVLIYAAGEAYNSARHFEGPDFIVSPQVVPMSTIEQADLVIAHAGLSLTLEVLRRGIPLLLLPQQGEQRANADHAVALGAALQLDSVQQRLSSQDFTQAMAELLSNPAYRQAAQAFAVRYRQLDPEQQVQEIAQRIVELAA